jgi:hypothetical protein
VAEGAQQLSGLGTRFSQQELETFMDVMQEGYYWGLLRMIPPGPEWEKYLRQERENTGAQAIKALEEENQ